MKEREYYYLGYRFEQWVFNGKRFFYPAWSGNIEFTDIRKICKYLKRVRSFTNQMELFK
jgi:hypothetical protein